MSVFRTFIIICFLSFEEVFSLSINTVAGNIVATKVHYCNCISKTNEQVRKEEFYSHIAEQHLGLGVDSYARYSGNPPGGDMKLLRSEFVSASGQFEDYRVIVRQGALCLWCREVLDASIKPVYTDINNLITPIRKILDGIEKAASIQQAAIITKVKKKIAVINTVADKINELSLAITSKLAIIEKLLSATDTFCDTNGCDTKVVMNSVPVNLQSILENLNEYTQTCKDIAEANTAGRLDLATLQKLKGIDLSYLESVLELLKNHILYVRSIFANIRETAMGVAKSLFENILNNGTLLRNGPHADSSINLLYQHDMLDVIMKAELDASVPSSSWYNGEELVDNRPIVQQIRLGFQFDGTDLFYGTMFPERP